MYAIRHHPTKLSAVQTRILVVFRTETIDESLFFVLAELLLFRIPKKRHETGYNAISTTWRYGHEYPISYIAAVVMGQITSTHQERHRGGDT